MAKRGSCSQREQPWVVRGMDLEGQRPPPLIRAIKHLAIACESASCSGTYSQKLWINKRITAEYSGSVSQSIQSPFLLIKHSYMAIETKVGFRLSLG